MDVSDSGRRAAAPARSPWTRIRKVLGRVRRSVGVDTFDVFTREVPPEPAFRAPEGYAFRWGTPEDVRACDPYHTELDERERSEGAARLEIGHRVVVASAGAEAVFTMWVNPRNLNVPGVVKRRLAEGQWFIYKAFTSPDHRGKKLYQAGMQFVLDEMRSAGRRELVGYAHVKKSVSRRGLSRLAFGSVGRMYACRVPGWQGTLVSRKLAGRFPERVARTGWSGGAPPAQAS